MLRLLPTLAVSSVLLASCTPKDAKPILEGKWISQSETDYAYWPSGDFDRAYKPFPIVGKFRMEITGDSIIMLDTKSANHPFLRRAYIRQDSVLFIRGNDRRMFIKRLTADTLTLVLQGDTSKYTRVDVGYTFSH